VVAETPPRAAPPPPPPEPVIVAEAPPRAAPAPLPAPPPAPVVVAEMPPLPPKMHPAAPIVSGGIFIQAGAFSVRDNAERVQSRIATLGSVRVTSASVNGIEVYRVRLGPVASEKEAEGLIARLAGSGYPGARIVAD
jgi:cell division protein FtsN